MSAKGPIAGFLVAILLAMSSWSSACDLSCALASRHIGSETAQPAASQKAEAADAAPMDMLHCMHDAAAGDTRSSEAPAVAATPCLHDICRQTAVSTAAKRCTVGAERRAAASIVVALAQPPHSGALRPLVEREYPPPRTSPLDPLSLSLRI